MFVRYAPSPTGILHLGNLRTAWISREIARELGLGWMVRYEDIDAPRVVSGAIAQQRGDLALLGLRADREVIQSENLKRHLDLFERARANGVIYPCTCSRQEVQTELEKMGSALHGEAPVYHGQCRKPSQREKSVHPTIAWRFLNPNDDKGRLDFIVARTDSSGEKFAPAYHWACAIDDYDSEASVLVRASDLAHAAFHQKLVYDWVSSVSGCFREYPSLYHTSLVVDETGHRLEKRTKGVTLSELVQLGWTPEKLAQAFEKSWDRKSIRDASGKISSGESATEIRVSLVLRS